MIISKTNNCGSVILESVLSIWSISITFKDKRGDRKEKDKIAKCIDRSHRYKEANKIPIGAIKISFSSNKSTKTTMNKGIIMFDLEKRDVDKALQLSIDLF
jgi:hypothetical protein